MDTKTAFSGIPDGLRTPLLAAFNEIMRNFRERRCYVAGRPVGERDITAWVEHSNASVYRRDVLRPAHRDRLIEYDERSGEVRISPRGIAYVEDNIPLESRD